MLTKIEVNCETPYINTPTHKYVHVTDLFLKKTPNNVIKIYK